MVRERFFWEELLPELEELVARVKGADVDDLLDERVTVVSYRVV